MTPRIEKTIFITAVPLAVWEVLTNPQLMKQWMGDPEMELEVRTDWEVGGPFNITGFHHIRFETGAWSCLRARQKLSYTHLSSVSRLPDQPESYTVFEFALAAKEQGTELTVMLTNFPTETIYKHLEFYWNTTLTVIREVVEKREATA